MFSLLQSLLCQEYEQLEIENGMSTGSNSKIIYDCMEDTSPYYDKLKEPFIDESDAIELPTDESLVQEARGRGYPYGPSAANNFLGPVNS